MKVMVVGSGAREHALCWKIAQSPLLTTLIAAPGNPGIAAYAEIADVRADDLDGLTALAVRESLDLVVVGPEDPLALGLVDRLSARGIASFGPTAAAARLEASKAFAKDLMVRHGIPTARYHVAASLQQAQEILATWELPVVIKADGLARGRGVTIARTRRDAEDTLHRYMVDRSFGERGATVVIEEFLEGEEVSLIGLSDGTRVITMAPAEDHKQLHDGDMGPNTGGMGAFSPVPAFGAEATAEAAASILQRTVDAMRSEGSEFRGALFAGLMLTAAGPKVLEFNVRFGDPEAEVILPRMASDLLPLLMGCARGSVDTSPVTWTQDAAVCVVLTSEGYPDAYASGRPITGSETAEGAGGQSFVFHAGTALIDGSLVTAGGRVLAVTALGPGLEEARSNAYRAADRIHFEGAYRRSDIGQRRPGFPAAAQ